MADSDETPDAPAGQESSLERFRRMVREINEMRAEFPSSDACFAAILKLYKQDGLTIEEMMDDMEAQRDVLNAWLLRLEFEQAKLGIKSRT